jgi:subtilase family serine protease
MRAVWRTLVAASAVLIAGCGGGSDDAGFDSRGVAAAPVEAAPAFHASPIFLDDPRRHGNHVLGDGQGTVYRIPATLDAVDTRNLSAEDIEAAQRKLRERTLASGASAPTRTIRVFNPAQIRAIYGLPPIPADLGTLTRQQAADLGAGQTIYVLSAFDAPNVLTDLQRFNAEFGLPQCRSVDLGTSGAALPPAPMDECTIAVVNVRLGSAITKKPHKFNDAWAKESTLDVQWAHATAPLARIVLLQGLNNFVNSFADSLRLAERMGPGVVSMSFAAGELFTYTEKYEVFFRGAGMTYVAAAGDWGSQGVWPATSPSVLAVGGTRLEGMVDGVRQETVWPRSGGGYSLYFATPGYQAGLPPAPVVTGKHASVRNVKPRSTSDIAFNADPFTGQFTVYAQPGRKPVWYSMGGTSIGTPQVAGMIAIANAHRLRSGKPHLGRFHDRLYAEIGPGIGAMTGALRDVRQGSNGSCALCTAGAGYDLPTGWGTPNADVLLPVLAGL